MSYEYITDNNLEQTQSYKYSKYSGMNFLKEYIAVRRQYITDKSILFDIDLVLKFIENCSADTQTDNQTFYTLKDIVLAVSQDKLIDFFAQINMFQKRFEVKKRVYTDYEQGKIFSGLGSYTDLNLYIILSAILLCTYFFTKKLTYFSTVIKINDTILSQYTLLDDKSKPIVSAILNCETALVNEMYKNNGLTGDLI